MAVLSTLRNSAFRFVALYLALASASLLKGRRKRGGRNDEPVDTLKEKFSRMFREKKELATAGFFMLSPLLFRFAEFLETGISREKLPSRTVPLTFLKWLLSLFIAWKASSSLSTTFSSISEGMELALLSRLLDALFLYIDKALNVCPSKVKPHLSGIIFLLLQPPLLSAVAGGGLNKLDKSFVRSALHWIGDITESDIDECFGFEKRKEGEIRSYHADRCLRYHTKDTVKSLVRSFRIYLPLHLFSSIAFKWKDWRNNHAEAVRDVLRKTCFSGAFLGFYISLAKLGICLSQWWAGGWTKRKNSKWVGGVGLLSGLAIFFEERKRRAELLIFALPHIITSAFEQCLPTRLKDVTKQFLRLFPPNSIFLLLLAALLTVWSKEAQLLRPLSATMVSLLFGTKP